MKYTFTLINSTLRSAEDKPEREKIVLESRAGESARHIALKILAYTLFKAEAAPLPLRIEQGVGQRHKPDLVALDPETQAASLWIDCGQIETRRLGRIAAADPRTHVVVVKATAGEARLYARAAVRFLPPNRERRELVSFVGFSDDFLVCFLAEMRGANELTFRAENLALTVTLNGVVLTTVLDHFTAASLLAAI